MKNETTAHRRMRSPIGSLALAGLLAGATANGAMLASSSYSVRDKAGNLLGSAVDNDIHTGALLASTQATVGLVIDLGSPSTVHRVYFTATAQALNPGTSDPELAGSRWFNATLRVGNSMTTGGAALLSRDLRSVTGREIRVEGNLRFAPTVGRYVVIDLNRGTAVNRWNVGEIEVYGWSGDRLAERRDAVVLSSSSPAPLKLAAEELTYYLGELGDHPVPTVTPDLAAGYPGTLYRIENLKPLALTYEQMTNNMAAGLFPATPVNVERSGRDIVFRAWPYRNVLWSVWEFLERQGVRWVYPDAHGDLVPTGQGIRTDVAPLQYVPSTDFIYANFGVEYLRDDPDAFLHFWRNRWSHTWGGHQRDVFDGTEVPAKPRPNVPYHPDYAEGFYGYPHNFENVLPERILAQHPDWCGMLTNQMWAERIGASNLGKRMLPSQNGTTFDLSSPGARQFIINKAIYYWNEHAKWNGNILWMLPVDSTLFSEDPQSVQLRGELVDDPEPFAMPYPYAVSGDYYDFICHIAEGVRQAIPEAKVGAMAYSNTHLPPERTTPFPSNVLVDVCLYGARNLPMSSPKNAEMRSRLETWTALASEVRHYDYDLIHRETGALRMPVPLVSAFADRARFYHEQGMLAGGTQADLDTLPYNPWNYYGYPRFHWKVDRDPQVELKDFFAGYFREAATPMLNYYNTLERFLIGYNVSLQARGYDYGLRVGAYPIAVLKKMNQHLLCAEAQATYWVTRQRLARMREGLEWVLQQRGLTVANLTSCGWHQHTGPGLSATIDLRTCRIRTAGQDVGDAWFLFSWAEVGDYIYFEQPGRYNVYIQAGMGYTDPTPRQREMMVHIGGLEYGPFPINHPNQETYTLIVDVPAGLVEVAVEDVNNDGPFEVSTITIEGSVADTSPEPEPEIGMRALSSPTTHIYDFAAMGNPAENIDCDWDGMSDLHEMIAGTDDLDPDSFFSAHCAPASDSGFQVSWPSVAGRQYSLYRATSLEEGFHLVASDLPATPPLNTFEDVEAGGATAFYQVEVR